MTVIESSLREQDLYYFREGTHSHLYRHFGAHSEAEGVRFGVWAPNAERVSVIGDFNGWQGREHPLDIRHQGSGVWEGFVEGLEAGANYKYLIESRQRGYTVEKADPFAFRSEVPPKTASRVVDLDYEWNDSDWMAKRRHANALDAPWAVYEVHLGSWMRRRADDGSARSLSYREIAEPLADYVSEAGFTHIEFLPLTEHPFFGSWGYQTTGYFAPTARYGAPQDLMYLIDYLHFSGIGVIMDWVPSHFPSDEHGLAYFDGTHLYEHEDPKQGYHPDWHSCIFNYGRHEVSSFLLSSAEFWLDHYHIDALRVDAVASMLYLDYGRKDGEWIPNRHGGRENLEAMSFLRTLNQNVYQAHPDVQTIAEESTAWPMVSRPTFVGGLGFGMKWNMGWMHDTLSYFSRDPAHRRFHHNEITFSLHYAFSENFMLPLSHDEVVYGKGSLLRKMPGDDWQRFAHLRALFGYMYTHPGKKLLFMGAEIGQWEEWAHEGELHRHLLEQPAHAALSRWVRDLNTYYRATPALYREDFSPHGFEWIDSSDSDKSVLSYIRQSDGDAPVVVIVNFTPVPRHSYRVGMPREGRWQETLNSDATLYGGSGQGNLGGFDTAPVSSHGRYHSGSVTVPPLGVVVFEHEDGNGS